MVTAREKSLIESDIWNWECSADELLEYDFESMKREINGCGLDLEDEIIREYVESAHWIGLRIKGRIKR